MADKIAAPAAIALVALATLPANARECAQKTATSWEITIASPDEPGDRLTVEGVVTDRKGKPIKDAIVYVYHTDAEGLYAPGNADPDVARLCGLMKTGADGRYRFTSIKPASYPGSTVPAHVHYVVSAPGIAEQQFLLEFEKDPHISRQAMERDRGEHAGLSDRYRGIRPLEKRDDGWHCRRDIVLVKRT